MLIGSGEASDSSLLGEPGDETITWADRGATRQRWFELIRASTCFAKTVLFNSISLGYGSYRGAISAPSGSATRQSSADGMLHGHTRDGALNLNSTGLKVMHNKPLTLCTRLSKFPASGDGLS